MSTQRITLREINVDTLDWYSSVLILLKSTRTRTCTQVLLKIKVLLTSTYKYFTSTSHLKLIQNSSQTNQYSGI